MGFRFSRRWCSTGGGPRGRCPPSWAGTRFFFWGSAPRGLCGDGCPCTHQCRRSAPRPGKLCGAGSPCAHRCEEGLRPSRSKSLDLALRSSPWGGRSAPPPRVTFPSRRKSPKARQGLRPLESPGAGSPPFSRSLRCAPARAGLPSATNPDRFATLSLWANRSFFPLGFCEGTPSGFRPWRGR